MKRKIFTALLIFSLTALNYVSAKTVNITFRLETGEINTSAGVYVGSDWAGWSFDKFQKLTDENNDSIFEVTIPLTAGASYNYRYTLGNTDWNHFEDLSATTCGFGPKKQDRNIVVPQNDSVLNVFCLSSCTDCKSTQKAYLNLSVDMSGETISPNGVHATGSFNAWDTGSLTMKDENNDGIYEVSVPVVAGKQTYEYKFLNGNAWGDEEIVFGTCEFRSNRLATVTGETVTMPVVKFGFCDAAGTPVSGTKIACIGNSITHGYGTSDMFTKCWPFQLRDLLGEGYYAENLGVSGRTMLKTGDMPWWNEIQYTYTFDLQPDIIVIKLGTNDSKSFNWNAVNYKADYIDMINKFREMPSHPIIYMITPAKAYTSVYGISDNVIKTSIIPILKEISFEKGVHLIDMYNATLKMAANFPDGVHPNDNGAKVIAQKVKDNILHAKPVISQIDATTDNTVNNAYQWFYNDAPIVGGNSQTINVSSAGKYAVAVKVSNLTDDIYVSEPFNLVLPATKSTSTVSLTTDISVPTKIGTEANASEVLIFPNPVENVINVQNAANTNLSIINALGEVALKQEVLSQNQTINLSGFRSGIYMMVLEKDNLLISKKIVVK